MATAKASGRRIQVKHILIAIIGTVTIILFIASIVLITIGYLNPFGSVGLGILGGGCVLFFSAVLFLCACTIWIKNKYYGDETDYKEKLVGRSSEDVTLLKPSPNVFAPEHPEAACKTIIGDNKNPIPLLSVSTVYSSVSSTSSMTPEKFMSNNGQQEDISAALDSDVFSTSPTALQHGDLKVQQRLEPTKRSTELLRGGYNGLNVQKVEDQLKNQHANRAAYNNQKYVSDLPRQRKPLVMESPHYVPHGNRDKPVETPLTNVQSAKTKETHFSTNKDLYDRNTHVCPVDTSKTTVMAPQHIDFIDQEKEEVPDKRSRDNVNPNPQTAERKETSIPESDPPMQNTTRANKQAIIRKDVITALAGNIKKKHNSSEETDKCNQDRTAIALQGLSPQNRLDQSANAQVYSHVITQKQVKPGNRTNQNKPVTYKDVST